MTSYELYSNFYCAAVSEAVAPYLSFSGYALFSISWNNFHSDIYGSSETSLLFLLIILLLACMFSLHYIHWFFFVLVGIHKYTKFSFGLLQYSSCFCSQPWTCPCVDLTRILRWGWPWRQTALTLYTTGVLLVLFSALLCSPFCLWFLWKCPSVLVLVLSSVHKCRTLVLCLMEKMLVL